jgi:hypothetical protein
MLQSARGEAAGVRTWSRGWGSGVGKPSPHLITNVIVLLKQRFYLWGKVNFYESSSDV